MEEMSIEHTSDNKQRVLFWGMNGVYSRTVLEILLQAGVDVVAVIIDGSAVPVMDRTRAYEQVMPPFKISPSQSSPSQTTSPVDELEISLGSGPYMAANTVNVAWRNRLPVYALGRLTAAATIELLASLNVDIACVACFPKRFPKTVLAMPGYGFLNVHPSRLPDYRGPAPLFWQLRDGVNPLGVTVHWMDATLDTGDVAAQADVTLPDGIDGPGADQRLAQVGGRLLVDVLDKIGRGENPCHAQPPGGSYQLWPLAKDFRLNRDWTARHAFNFMRGTAEWGRPYPLTIGDEELLLRHALDVQPQQPLAAHFHQEGPEIHIQFASGVLVAAVWK